MLANKRWFTIFDYGNTGSGVNVAVDNVGTELSFSTAITAATNYVAPNQSGLATAVTTENDYAKIIFSRAGILKNLYVQVDQAPGTAKQVAVTVRVAPLGLTGTSADTTLTATIGATATGASDTTDEILVNQGDAVSIKSVQTGSGSSLFLAGSIQFVPLANV